MNAKRMRSPGKLIIEDYNEAGFKQLGGWEEVKIKKMIMINIGQNIIENLFFQAFSVSYRGDFLSNLNKNFFRISILYSYLSCLFLVMLNVIMTYYISLKILPLFMAIIKS